MHPRRLRLLDEARDGRNTALARARYEKMPGPVRARDHGLRSKLFLRNGVAIYQAELRAFRAARGRFVGLRVARLQFLLLIVARAGSPRRLINFTQLLRKRHANESARVSSFRKDRKLRRAPFRTENRSVFFFFFGAVADDGA